MEIVDIISRDGTVTGQAPKEEAHRLGLPHRVSAILVQHSDGKFPIPTAADHKPEAGRLYHSAAGHVTSGESYLDSAVRELFEETGVSAKASQLISLGHYWLDFTYPTRTEHERFELFSVTCPEDTPITLNDEQVNPAWYSLGELKTILDTNPEKVSLPLRLTLENILLREPVDA